MDYFKNIFTKILKLWGNTSIIWVYIILRVVIINLSISSLYDLCILF